MSSVLKWFIENTGIKVHEAVNVTYSTVDDPSSGFGLFVDLNVVKIQPYQETVELLRVPKTITFDIHTLLALFDDGSQFSSKHEFERANSRVKAAFSEFVSFPHVEEIVSETFILVFLFVLFELIKKEYELPPVLQYYLENVLLKTKIDSAAMCPDLMKTYYGQYGASLMLCDQLDTLESFFVNHLKEITCPSLILRQIYAAISSRCLEIPQEVDSNTDDFLVNSTLVPVIDFANHDNKLQNAHFDVDRKTNDVLLLLDVEKCASKNEPLEVFISYSPVEDLFSFIFTYGFAPSTNNKIQFMNISIDRKYLRRHAASNINLHLFFKWLNINPVIQLIKFRDQWYINDVIEDFAYILLAFTSLPGKPATSCWTYDSESYKTFSYFHLHANKEEEDEEDEESLLKRYKRSIEWIENDHKDFINLPPLAWSMQFESEQMQMCRGRFTKEQALEIAPFGVEEVFQGAIESFSKFFMNYMEWRTDELGKSEITLPSFKPVVVQLETNALQQILNGHKLLFWSDTDVNLNNYECELPPMLPTSAYMDSNVAAHSKEPHEEIIESQNFTLNGYNPTKLTDFLEDELELFSHLV